MKRTATISLSIAALIILWSCGSDTKTTPMGYTFKFIKHGDGKVVKPGEIVVLDMAILDSNDSAWYDNRNSDYPEIVKIADPSRMETERGIVETFRMLSKGDSIELSMKAKDVFLFMWKMDTPPQADPESYFTYYVKCREVFNDEQVKDFIARRDSIHEIKEQKRIAAEEEQKRIAEAELEEYNKAQLAKDTVIIDNYLKGKNVKAKKLPNGLRYVVRSNGEGPLAAKGDIVNMKYTGQLLDGKEFGAGEYSFAVGNKDVVAGWDLIAPMMKKGTSLTVFVPSTLAYGRGGSGSTIGPDAILVFDMELLSINKR